MTITIRRSEIYNHGIRITTYEQRRVMAEMNIDTVEVDALQCFKPITDYRLIVD